MNETNWMFVLFFYIFSYRRVRLDPTAVKNEVELLKRLCAGKGEERALKSVRYTAGLNYLHMTLGGKESICYEHNESL